MYIHYQPSYCAHITLLGYFDPLLTEYWALDHFHVHVVNANFVGLGLGMTVGQAHLLDDVISLVSAYLPRMARLMLTLDVIA